MPSGTDRDKVLGVQPVLAPHASQKMRARKIALAEVVEALDHGVPTFVHRDLKKVEGVNGVVVGLDQYGVVVSVYRVAPRTIPRGRVLGPDAGVGEWRRPLSRARNRSARRLRVVE